LSHYEALLSLLQQLCRTKVGATHVLNAGLFQAVRESQLFAADPDIGIGLSISLSGLRTELIGIDIDNPDSLRKYYDLLLSVIQVITSAVFVRGIHNAQILEQTRTFLTENRQSMVGIFKRYAKVGGTPASDSYEILRDLIKPYVALITAAGFVEVS
jgi:nuclear pore complex protein Nup205